MTGFLQGSGDIFKNFVKCIAVSIDGFKGIKDNENWYALFEAGGCL